MIDLTGFKDKLSKDPEAIKLFEQKPYLEAYSLNTDDRIEKDGPHLAVGSTDGTITDWETHGDLQLHFLKCRGLKPDSTLLDLGCGTGRLARKAVKFLDDGHYTGVDISVKALAQCEELAKKEKWIRKNPKFILGNGNIPEGQFNYIWAHSVFTHTPIDIAEKILREISTREYKEFIFTYKKSDQDNYKRIGLKQFMYNPYHLIALGEKCGVKLEPLSVSLPGGQWVMVCRSA